MLSVAVPIVRAMTALKTLGIAFGITFLFTAMSWLRGNRPTGNTIAVADLLGFLIVMLVFWGIAYLVATRLPKRKEPNGQH